jgi:hypothetical protein
VYSLRSIRWLPLAAILLWGIAHAGPAAVKAPPAPVRVIVSYTGATDAVAATTANQAVGVHVLRALGDNALLVELPAGMSLEDGLRLLGAEPGIRHVEADGMRRADPLRGPKIEPSK